MREKVYKTKISDVRFESILFDEAFYIKLSEGVNGIISHIKHMHRHSTYEIFFVLDGTLKVTDTQGSYYYSNKVVIIPPQYDHYTVSEVKSGYCFYFTAEHISDADGKLFSQLEKILSSGITSFELNESIVFYLSRVVECIDKSTSDEKISHLLYLIFSELCEKLISVKQKNSTVQGQNKYIHIIESYVTNCEINVNLCELAKELYLSPKQVSRIIKKEFGCSLTELMNRRRLTVACSLLKHTNLTVRQISEAVGYEYENYFFSVFKKAYGITPLQYRKKHKNTTSTVFLSDNNDEIIL